MNRQIFFALLFALIIGIGVYWLLNRTVTPFPQNGKNVSLVDGNGGEVLDSTGSSSSFGGSAVSANNMTAGNRNPVKTGSSGAPGSGNNNLSGSGAKQESRIKPGHNPDNVSGSAEDPGKNGISSGNDPHGLRPFKGSGVGTLVVEVLNEEGDSCSKVSILLSSSYGELERVTGGDGIAAFGRLPSGRYTLTVQSDEGFQGRTTSIALSRGEQKKVTLRCSSSEQVISGRALDSDGNLLSGVTVQLSPDTVQGEVIDLWRFKEAKLKTETGNDGFYSFNDLPKGTFLLTAKWDLTGETKRSNVSAPSNSEDLVFRAPFEIEISGTCEAEDGNPIEGVTVSVLGKNVVIARSDNGGFYRLVTKSVSWSGTVYLSAHKNGYKKQQKSISLDKEENGQGLTVNFVLETANGNGEISGLLMDREGRMVSGETILLVSSIKRVQKHARSGSDGSFFFDGLEAASDYRLSVFPQKLYKDLRRTGISVGEGERVEVELVLDPVEVGVIEGIASDGANRPLSGFTFRIRSDQSWSQDLRVVTGSDGSFRKEDVPSGNILFDTSATPHFSIRGLKLADGEEKNVKLVFGTGEKVIEGVVKTQSGEVVPGAKIVMSWVKTSGGLTSSVQYSTVTDSSGWYRVMDLASGEYRVQVRAGGLAPKYLKKNLSGDGKWDFILPVTGNSGEK